MLWEIREIDNGSISSVNGKNELSNFVIG